MATYSKGSRALMISMRSGAAFPYTEMVQEWTGAWVHNSEFEVKQPQLTPRPVSADAQALEHAYPARTEFPVQDFISVTENGFGTPFFNSTSFSGQQQLANIQVVQPGHNLITGDSVRFQAVKTVMQGGGLNPVYGIGDIEQSAILTNDITATSTTINITPQNNNYSVSTNFPGTVASPGFVVIEKVNATTGRFENEVISYTGTTSNGTTAGSLTGCVRGTSTVFRGFTPPPTTANIHLAGAKLNGSRPVTVGTDNLFTPPITSFAALAKVGAWAVSDEEVIGGGLQCTYGPLNDRA